MKISGEKILLRSPELSDTDILHQWENDKAHWDVSGTQKPFTKKEIENFISNQKDIYLDKQLRFMICTNHSPLTKGDKGVVGCIDLFNFDGLKAGIGILIDKKHRKNGYASDALSLLVNYSFEILNLKQLYSNVSEDNTASMKLFQKHDFKITGKKKYEHVLQLMNKQAIIAAR